MDRKEAEQETETDARSKEGPLALHLLVTVPFLLLLYLPHDRHTGVREEGYALGQAVPRKHR